MNNFAYHANPLNTILKLYIEVKVIAGHKNKIKVLIDFIMVKKKHAYLIIILVISVGLEEIYSCFKTVYISKIKLQQIL